MQLNRAPTLAVSTATPVFDEETSCAIACTFADPNPLDTVTVSCSAVSPVGAGSASGSGASINRLVPKMLLIFHSREPV